MLWLSSFCSSFGKCLFYTCRLRYAELQIHKTAFQVNKFSAFLCVEWCKSQDSLILFPWYVPQPSGACNPAFSVSSGFTIGSGWSGCGVMTVRWCWLKIWSQPESRELFYLVRMFQTLSPGDNISVALRNLPQGGKWGSQGIYKFATKGAGTLKIKDQVSRNLAFHVWEDASLWAHWIHSFHTHLSYLGPILFPCSPCFLHSPSSLAITMVDGSTLWIAVLGALIHIWKPEIADNCDISCLLIWQDIFSLHNGRYFPSLGLTGSHWRAAIRSHPLGHEWPLSGKCFMINFCPTVLGGSSQLSQKFLLCHSRS